MADLLEQIRQQLSARLAELRPLVDEHARLEGALQALGEPQRPPSSAAAARSEGRAAAADGT